MHRGGGATENAAGEYSVKGLNVVFLRTLGMWEETGTAAKSGSM